MSTKFATQKRAIIAAVMAVILLVGLMVPTVSAYAEPTSAEKRAEAQQVLSQLEEMQVKLDEASNNYYAALEAQEEAEAKVVEAQAKVDEKNKRNRRLSGATWRPCARHVSLGIRKLCRCNSRRFFF